MAEGTANFATHEMMRRFSAGTDITSGDIIHTYDEIVYFANVVTSFPSFLIPLG